VKFIIYCDKKKEWRWRLKAKNGRVLADSGEGYKRRAACERCIALVMDSASARMEWNSV